MSKEIAVAVKKENTTDIICKGCKQKIVLVRTSKKVFKTLAMCPFCGAGISYIWINT
jgi:hypothetical protein